MKKASTANALAMGILGIVLLVTPGCLSFNRDALWNAAIKDNEYCTYWKGDFPVGSMFVHREDDWTAKRLKYGYELTVTEIRGNTIRLEHGWAVYGQSHFDGEGGIVEEGRKMRTRPILVSVLDSSNLKVGDMFKEYGQYKYECDLDGEKGEGKIPYLVQVNRCQDLVAEPYPFIHHW